MRTCTGVHVRWLDKELGAERGNVGVSLDAEREQEIDRGWGALRDEQLEGSIEFAAPGSVHRIYFISVVTL